MSSNVAIRNVHTLLNGSDRADAYSRILDQVSSEGRTLSEADAKAIADALGDETDPRARAYAWRLAALGPRHPMLRDMALARLGEAQFADRGDALLYLRVAYPELMPQIAERVSGDLDPETRYQLSEYIGTFDTERSVDMKIAVLPVESHELNDALIFEISDLANRGQLEELERKDKAGGGNTVFGTIARIVRDKLPK